MVERLLAKEEVAGSKPVSRSSAFSGSPQDQFCGEPVHIPGPPEAFVAWAVRETAVHACAELPATRRSA